MIASPDEVQSRAPLLPISVNIADELRSQPGKNDTEQSFDGNAILCAVKFRKQKPVDRFSHSKRGKQHDRAKEINFQTLDQLKASGVTAVGYVQKLDGHTAPQRIGHASRARTSDPVPVLLNNNLKLHAAMTPCDQITSRDTFSANPRVFP